MGVAHARLHPRTLKGIPPDGWTAPHADPRFYLDARRATMTISALTSRQRIHPEHKAKLRHEDNRVAMVVGQTARYMDPQLSCCQNGIRNHALSSETSKGTRSSR